MVYSLLVSFEEEIDQKKNKNEKYTRFIVEVVGKQLS